MTAPPINWTSLIERLGGARQVARDLSTATEKLPHDTVYAWRKKNSVPTWRQAPLLQLAVAKGVPIHTGAAVSEANVRAVAVDRLDDSDMIPTIGDAE